MASADPHRRRICVVGGGVIGLSTAVRLLDEVPNVDVTVISAEFSPNTTGDGSAGFWRPYFVADTPKESIRKWGKDTFDHLYKLSTSSEGGSLGVFSATGYDIYKNPANSDNFWKDIVFGHRPMTDAELQQFSGGYRCGFAYTTMMCECKTYLPWLLKRFISKGGRCIQRKVNNLSEVAGDYDIIVNCPGVWAGELVNDKDVAPLKGQLIKVDAPWVKHFVNAEDDDLYILVGSKSIALGGTHEKGDWTSTIDPTHRQRIWQGCCRLVPSLETAKVVDEWVGFRPGRSSGIRLEREQIVVANKVINVIHNYGHGGSGVTLHWGCAGDAVKLVKESLPSLSSKL